MAACATFRSHTLTSIDSLNTRICALSSLELFSLYFFDLISEINSRGIQLSLLQRKIDHFVASEKSYHNGLKELMPQMIAFDLAHEPSRCMKKNSSIIEALDLEPPKIPSFSKESITPPRLHKKFFEVYLSKFSYARLNEISCRIIDFHESLDLFKGALRLSLSSHLVIKNKIREYKIYIPSFIKTMILEKTIGKLLFVQERLLGEGSYGRVFLIRKNRQLFALKEFKQDPNTSEVERDQSLTIEAINNFLLPPHPCITKILGYCNRGLLFEFVPDGIIYQFFKKKDVSYISILFMFKSIAEALCHIHAHGFIHKDLKCNNVLIHNFPPFAKICDLGFMCDSTYDDDDVVAPLIAAPEIFFSQESIPFTAKLDVWAFGVLLYQMITGGRYPFFHLLRSSETFQASVATRCYNHPCSTSALKVELSKEELTLLAQRDPHATLLQLVALCLHGNPHERISMEDGLTHLNKLIESFWV